MNEKKCDVEVFSRVTGFFRPVQSWNAGKTEEFKDRQKFKVEASMVEDATRRTAKTLVS